MLSLLNRVLPEKRRNTLLSTARRRALDLIRALLGAVIRRLTRLLAGAPEPPASHRRRRTAPPALALPGTAVTVPPPRPVPGREIGSFLDRVRGARDERQRGAALQQTLTDLERVIQLLRGIDRSMDAEGLERSYQQIQQLADPYARGTGFEVNMAWMLLERELKAVADRLAA